ncbi:HEAT repeat domain-containing protein [Dyadobacter sp. CY356]|uniref:HEAT repeat domain-containing protein n=1 Tax=Dyadobacter sp. CY356 TaxID=2906442 RepID=UPI001F3475EA|nr:HEAT repeat domain-containing protein [Dyadobacter sp. CY356]MCF0056196.1 MFS transporter [Dyadobacter sp. CY356]
MWKNRSVLNLLKIKQGEENLVFLLIGYSFFMGGATAVFYTIVVSSFLINFESSFLPYAYIAGGILVYLVGMFIGKLQKMITSEKLGEGMLISLISSIVILLVLYQITGNKWVFFALFIWNRFFVLVNGVTFWAIVGKLFNFQQSKRLSGLINTGEVIASVVAYLSMPLLIKFLNMNFLLIFVVVLLMACSYLIHTIHRNYLSHDLNKVKQTSEIKEHTKPVEKLDKGYYKVIFILAVLPVFGLFYVEYIFFTESRVIFPNKESLASFLAVFFGICSIVEFFIKSFFYNRLLAKYGMRIGIIILPVSLAFSFLLAVVYGLSSGPSAIFFACIVLARFFLSAVRKAISDPVYQILYQPIPAAFRLKIQGRIEGRAKSVGGLLAGVILLILHRLSIVDDVALSIVFLAVTMYWIFTSVRGQGAYKQIVRDKVFIIPEKPVYKVAEPQIAEEHPADYEEVLELTSSSNGSDRYRAAYNLGRSNRFMSYKYLIPLLQDKDPHVREVAIVASGELKREELWPYLFEQLDQDRFYTMASQALVKSGTPLLKQIERSFASRSEGKLFQIKLLEIVKGIGGSEGIRFLRKNIANPNRYIKEKVTSSLRDLGYKATVLEQTYFLQEFDDYVASYVWVLAAQADLFNDYEEDSQLMIVLEKEKELIMLKAFTVLEVLYGSKFNVIVLLDGDQQEDVRDYLIEIADLMLPEDVKNKLLPFLESTTLHEMLNRYQEIFPQNQLTVEERLKDIVNKDYTRISRWTKSIAMLELKHYSSESVTPLLVSNALSSSKVVSETAFYILRIVNPKRFSALFKIIHQKKDDFHKAIMEPLDWLSSEEDLLISKLRRLRGMEQLGVLSNENLQRILLHSTYFNVEMDDVTDLRKFTNDREVSLIVTYGKLVFSGQNHVVSGDIWDITEHRKRGIVMIPNAMADSEFYIVETYILRDLSVEMQRKTAVVA